MNTLFVRLIGAGSFFLAIFLSGFWLSRSGKPYSSLYLNIHKLIALAAVVFLVMTVTRLNQVARLNTLELTVCLIAALLFLLTIISGGLASIPKDLPAAISNLHHLLPWVTILSTVVTLYLLHRSL